MCRDRNLLGAKGGAALTRACGKVIRALGESARALEENGCVLNWKLAGERLERGSAGARKSGRLGKRGGNGILGARWAWEKEKEGVLQGWAWLARLRRSC
jgi:hypothetical protein